MKVKPVSFKERGSALVLALLLISIVSLGAASLMSGVKSREAFSRLFRVKATLEMAASSGLNKARVDLLDRATSGDFTTTLTTLSTRPNATSLTSEEVGLIYGEGGIAYPRIEFKEGDHLVSVWFYPHEDNPGEKDNDDAARNRTFPKLYRVVSSAVNTSSGRKYVVEAGIKVRLQNAAEFSYGMLNPRLPPGMTEFVFVPAIYGGHVHFGKNLIPYLTWGDDAHEFRGPVTFHESAPAGQEHPFNYQEDLSEIHFEKGYKTGYQLNFDAEAMLTSVAEQANSTLSPEEEHCLKFQGSQIEVYDCNVDIAASVFERYVGEVQYDSSSDSWIIGANPREIISIPAEGLVIHSNENVHVKGVLEGNVTIASEKNIVLEGDIPYADQSNTSTNRLGLLARKNVTIPPCVPTCEDTEWIVNRREYEEMSPNEWSTNPGPNWRPPYNNVTNFYAPNDRDKDLRGTEYPDRSGMPDVGWDDGGNRLSVMDIDAMVVAVEGGLQVEAINNYDDSQNGVAIPGWTIDTEGKKVGAYYSSNSTDENYFYNVDTDGKVIGRKAMPLACRDGFQNGDGVTCPFAGNDGKPNWNEIPRQSLGDLWIYGGLVTNDYTLTSVQYGNWARQGFRRRVIKHNPNQEKIPPPGFPSTGKIIVETFWKKSGSGQTESVATTGL